MASLGRFAKGAAALLLALSLLAGMPATLALGLSPSACRVKDIDTGITKRSLQAAVDVASRGHHLRLRGACHGTTTIRKGVTITGIQPEGAAKPRLDGDRAGSVVTVARGITVVIKRLTITDGAGVISFYRRLGGGLLNRGRLTLSSVRVEGNRVRGGFRDGGPIGSSGGGVYNTGTLTVRGSSTVRGNLVGSVGNGGGGGGVTNTGTLVLHDSSSITGNKARGGSFGGVENTGTLLLYDASTIRDNTAFYNGGGVLNTGRMVLYDASAIVDNRLVDGQGGGVHNSGTLTLKGSSEISGNEARLGGGVYNQGTLTLKGSSEITGNAASVDGAGVYNDGGAFDTNQCGPGMRVHDNAGGDCAP